jgi:hypothetical protein
MKSFCDYKFTCLYSSCCTLIRYQQEINITHFILLTITLIISTISTLLVLKRKSYQFKPEEDEVAQQINNINALIKKAEKGNSIIADKKNSLTFTKKYYISDTLSIFNYVNLLSNTFTKNLTIYLILSKLIEIFIVQNYFSIKDQEYIITDGNKILSVINKMLFEFFGLLAIYSIIQFTTQVIEYYIRLILLILIYTAIMFDYYFVYIYETYNSHFIYRINTYVCLAIILLQIMLCFYAMQIYFYKISKLF